MTDQPFKNAAYDKFHGRMRGLIHVFFRIGDHVHGARSGDPAFSQVAGWSFKSLPERHKHHLANTASQSRPTDQISNS